MKTKSAAFTLIELLVVISIIAILASLAIPAVTGALVRGQMTQTLNNARQVQLATMTMSLDAVSTGEGPTWGFSSGGTAVGIAAFASNLVSGKYIQSNDIIKLFTAPGITASYPLTTNSGLKVYAVSEADSGTCVFVTTKNYVYGTDLTSGATPYGDKGFIALRKGGDGSIYKASQATNTNAIGILTTNASGSPMT